MSEPRHDNRADRTPRLDQPVTDRRRARRPAVDPEKFGRFSERIARFMGTAKFLMYMTGFVTIWVLWNLVTSGSLRFDEYPFIFLTLMLSLQASYAAPLILLAQNRQDDRDRVAFEQDRARDERNLADTEYLTREVAALRLAMRETVTRDYLRSELRDLLGEMEQRGALPPAQPAKKNKAKGGKQRSGKPSAHPPKDSGSDASGTDTSDNQAPDTTRASNTARRADSQRPIRGTPRKGTSSPASPMDRTDDTRRGGAPDPGHDQGRGTRSPDA